MGRERAKPVAQIAADLGVAESALRRWMAQSDVDEGKKEGLTTAEREELARLRREMSVAMRKSPLVARARSPLVAR